MKGSYCCKFAGVSYVLNSTFAGMGAEVQYEMYLPGYDSMRELNGNIGNVSWPANHQKAFGRYHALFPSKPEMDGRLNYDKEQLKETILKQEVIFRHQLQELHRLYKMQMDIMNEVRNKESQMPLHTVGQSQSSSFTFSPEDEKKNRHPNSIFANFNGYMPFTSDADNIQSPIYMNGKIMQSGCSNPQKALRFEDDENFGARSKKLQRKFDLELPADKYIYDKDDNQQTHGGSGLDSYSPNKNYETVLGNGVSLSCRSGVYPLCNGGAFGPNMNLKGTKGFTDLNEPFKIEKASGTTCFGIGHIPSANSCSDIQGTAKEIYQNLHEENDVRVDTSSSNLENQRKQESSLSYSFTSGQNLGNRNSQLENLRHGYMHTLCESSQVGSSKGCDIYHTNTEHGIKKMIFGVEISERSHTESGMGLDKLVKQPLKPESNPNNSESSSFSCWKKFSAKLGENFVSIEENPAHGLYDGMIRPFPSSRAESCQNASCTVSELESKESRICHGTAAFGYANGFPSSGSVSEQIPLSSSTNNCKGLGWLMNAKSRGQANMTCLWQNYQKDITSDSKFTVDSPRIEENPTGGLSWLKVNSVCNGRSPEVRNGSQHMSLDFLQSFHKAEMLKNLPQSFVQDSASMAGSQNAVIRKTEVGDCSSKRKILVLPIVENHLLKDPPSATAHSKPSGRASDIKDADSFKVGLLDADRNYNPVSFVAKVSTDSSDDARCNIDLNVSVTDEDAQPTRFPPRARTKGAVEIDLEAPVIFETEEDFTIGDQCGEVKEPINLTKDNFKDFEEGLMSTAAETLVVISSSGIRNFLDNHASPHQLDSSLSDSLQWFAEVISDFVTDDENNHVSTSPNGIGCEDFTWRVMDYFEYMTLNLKESEVEECHYVPPTLENMKDEITLPRRPRRGQSRRGRQRKDFQRDILPGLTSLSRNDVTEDLQTIEGLLTATGAIQESTWSHLSSPKSKGGRGRKRSRICATPTSTAATPTQQQQPKCGELGLEETRLAGWGKRTRRPPRQRCPVTNPILAVQ
ncbi:hypothetical protein K2173_020016 [Erythroxylum novogranatense]|uniref:Uncharacterized protein n=1 Tax=Erythroxylum novogranatense TaxID=1862640 RepID=A0AAV8U6Q8_9ROSI|nr:hypothetical protein K2173_020016 [Erythroxylum novogranatense]